MTSSPGPGALVDRVVDAATATGITRRNDDRWVAGICSGIAARYDIDPVVVRVATITLSILTGFGVVAYGTAYLLLPGPEQPSPLARWRSKGVNPVVLLVALGVLTVCAIGATFGGADSFGSWSSFPVIPVLIGAALVYYFKGYATGGGCQHGRRRRSGRARGPLAGRRSPDGERPAAPPPPPSGSGASSSGTPGPQDDTGSAAGRLGPPVLIPVPAAPGSAAPTPAASSGGPVPFPQQLAPSTAQTEATSQQRHPTAVQPPRIPRPRHRRLGIVGTLAGLGAGLAAYGLGVLVFHASGAAGSARPVGLAAALAALALVLIVAGSRGRRGGLVALAAVPLAIACSANAATGSDVWADGAGERTWTPTSTAPITYRLGAGEAVLDLSRYPQRTAAARETPRIEASVAFGQLAIVVPKDLTVRVDSTIRWGNISEDDAIAGRRADTGGNNVRQSHTYGSGEPDLVVAATVTAGELAVTRK